jgi:hypothetical protein
MLFALIAIAWISVAAFFVLICRAAGRADRDAHTARPTHKPTAAPVRLVVRGEHRSRPVRVPSAGMHRSAQLSTRTARTRGSHSSVGS